MQIRPNFPSLVPQRSMQNSMAFPDTYPELEYHTSCVSFKSRNNVCRCFVYHIRDLRRNRRFISLSVAKSIATALVSSRLDYYNSLLYNTANKDIAELQRVQLFLARVVTHSPRLSRSVPLLKIIALAPCARLHYFQDLYNRLSSTPIYTTSISEFDAKSSKKFQTAMLNQ